MPRRGTSSGKNIPPGFADPSRVFCPRGEVGLELLESFLSTYLVASLVKAQHPDYHADLQRIRPNGSKRFLSSGMVKGCSALIGAITPGEPLYITESFATGATIHEQTGAAVACAMTADNLLEAGQRLQRQYPDAVLIVPGDDDRQTEGNPGRSISTKALPLNDSTSPRGQKTPKGSTVREGGALLLTRCNLNVHTVSRPFV